jgi:hypothetical protein
MIISYLKKGMLIAQDPNVVRDDVVESERRIADGEANEATMKRSRWAWRLVPNEAQLALEQKDQKARQVNNLKINSQYFPFDHALPIDETRTKIHWGDSTFDVLDAMCQLNQTLSIEPGSRYQGIVTHQGKAYYMHAICGRHDRMPTPVLDEMMYPKILASQNVPDCVPRMHVVLDVVFRTKQGNLVYALIYIEDYVRARSLGIFFDEHLPNDELVGRCISGVLTALNDWSSQMDSMYGYPHLRMSPDTILFDGRKVTFTDTIENPLVLRKNEFQDRSYSYPVQKNEDGSLSGPPDLNTKWDTYSICLVLKNLLNMLLFRSAIQYESLQTLVDTVITTNYLEQLSVPEFMAEILLFSIRSPSGTRSVRELVVDTINYYSFERLIRQLPEDCRSIKVQKCILTVSQVYEPEILPIPRQFTLATLHWILLDLTRALRRRATEFPRIHIAELIIFNDTIIENEFTQDTMTARERTENYESRHRSFNQTRRSKHWFRDVSLQYDTARGDVAVSINTQ